MAITAFISAPSHSQSPLLLLRPSPSLSFKSKPFRSPLRPYAALRPAPLATVGSAPLVADRSKRGRFVTAVADSEAAPPETTVIPVAVEVEVEEGGGDGSGGGEGSDGGGGGGGGDDRGGDPEDGEGGSDKDKKKISGMSMSQKLTLGYAALVGVGGVMGYMKSGSQKSLAAGGISAALLYYVYTQLPARPAFASSLGLGISAALLAVMGSRFKKSGKIFPAGVVSLVSLVMVGGYFHGILRGQHA
ncbi:uncharacterized protein [Elaeis guineensis]|uniref:Protein FATTY ACID EXPORT 2, chloroplastic n=1 Tax=Elaeis guineensis var. tenera TaxID=51953 RepID=A0A6I9R020_ELAGV|nr:protein FATTY ACID EXPORT 2, chloroplastic [Elaeis guineensis]